MGICAHTVAVAEINNKLPHFLASKKRAKRSPSITTLLTSQMPKGCGKKVAALLGHERKANQLHLKLK